jgi:chromosome segregation ATPase
VEGHSSRLEQVEDRISELKDKIEIKKNKTEELLAKQFKNYERNMQELTNSIKKLNLRIMGIEEREEVQAKGIRNIFHKIITKNFSKLEKAIPIQVWVYQTDLTKIELPHDILSLKQQTQRKEEEY